MRWKPNKTGGYFYFEFWHLRQLVLIAVAMDTGLPLLALLTRKKRWDKMPEVKWKFVKNLLNSLRFCLNVTLELKMFLISPDDWRTNLAGEGFIYNETGFLEKSKLCLITLCAEVWLSSQEMSAKLVQHMLHSEKRLNKLPSGDASQGVASHKFNRKCKFGVTSKECRSL